MLFHLYWGYRHGFLAAVEWYPESRSPRSGKPLGEEVDGVQVQVKSRASVVVGRSGTREATLTNALRRSMSLEERCLMNWSEEFAVNAGGNFEALIGRF